MNWQKLDRDERLNRADEIVRELTNSGSLGERIKIVRLIYKETQAIFSDKLGVSRSYLSEAENEKGKPSIEMIIGIADYFTHLNVQWLLTGEGSFLNPVAYDEDGWSIPRERHLDYRCLLNVFTLIEEKLGEDWLSRQKGPRRKSDLLSYFYEKYCATFIEAKTDKKLSTKQAHDFASVELAVLIDRFNAMGLPSVRHRELEL